MHENIRGDWPAVSTGACTLRETPKTTNVLVLAQLCTMAPYALNAEERRDNQVKPSALELSSQIRPVWTARGLVVILVRLVGGLYCPPPPVKQASFRSVLGVLA